MLDCNCAVVSSQYTQLAQKGNFEKDLLYWLVVAKFTWNF